MFKIKNKKSKIKITIQNLKILHFALSFWILLFGFWISWAKAQGEVAMKKAVMIIAHDGFRDEELQEPKIILEKDGIDVTVSSSDLSEAKGMLGGTVQPDILVSDIDVADYNAIIFVGGSGAQEYWNDSTAHTIAKEALDKDKVVAAICIAPVTLANAGILKGKKATVWSSEAGQLKKAGANYTGSSVEVDGNIITASGPQAAKDFGQAIVKKLR